MGYLHIERAFRKMGAEIVIEERPFHSRFPTTPRNYTLNIIENKNDEYYSLLVHKKGVEFQVVNQRDDLRHLLLFARDPFENKGQQKRKLLCGHDERHWFVAGVPSGTITVQEAFGSLKPKAALASQVSNGVKQKALHKRHNAGFQRQGEWFFIPQPDFVLPASGIVHRNEPIRRSTGGKPHAVEELYRTGGELVYTSPYRREGVDQATYEDLMKHDEKARRYNWLIQRRNPRAYARGRVSHKDHATLWLPHWHLIQMNGEVTMQVVAFLD